MLIAVRGKDIKVKGLSWEIAYDRKRGIDRKSTPDNLRVDICINNKDIHIWGIRIKDLSGNYDKRKVEMKTLVEWVNNTTGINIIVGDFNNLREDTIIGTWNLKVLDELLGDKLERETPKENYSWGVAKSKDQFVGYIKNDHLIHSKEVEANVDEYIWDFLKKCDYELKAPAFGRQQLKIPVCQPDHGILIGTVTI